jgi:transposase
MAEKRRRFDAQFRAGAVRIVLETGKPIAQVARDLGIHDGTLGNWVNQARSAAGGAEQGGGLSESEREELARLRRENAELAMERDVLKRSVVLWVKEAMK